MQVLFRYRHQGRNITITLVVQSEEEQSVSIYHEMLETLTVAFDEPPNSVMLMNEVDFEQAGWEAHRKFGFASTDTVLSFLKGYGFYE